MRIKYYPKSSVVTLDPKSEVVVVKSEVVTYEAVEIYKYTIRKQNHYWILYLESEDKSWMVLKEPPTESEIKILAIPLKKLNRESRRVWDEGEYWLDFQEDKKITFNITKGDKLKGVYCLIKYNKNWLFFKRRLRDWEIEMQNEK